MGEMTGVEKVFAGSAIVGGALFTVRLILLFIGGAEADTDFDADVDMDFDVDADLDVGDADVMEAGEGSYESFRLLSFQSVTAFFMMFGLVGLALLREARVEEAWAIIGAIVAGAFSFWVIAKIMVFMRGLQSSGTMNLANAVGQEGTVYLGIPADGVGKVRVTVQERLKVFNAVSGKGRPFKTGERIVVTGVSPDNTLIVDEV
ncbi:MAG: hypothetical protein AMK73_00910 [Planctomycetes bacterium SM23_32]|nr:MAG: hypothetical protein AMK73_00910 [Planctomycetes bacterium SM23_32]